MNTNRILLVLMLLVSAILACDSAPNKPNVRRDFAYDVTAVAVADYDRDLSEVAVDVLRDSSSLRTALVRLANDTLDLAEPAFAHDSIFYRLLDLGSSLRGTNLPFLISDSNFENLSYPITVPDTFSILTVEPPNRIVTGLQPVSVSWSGSNNADGYVLATVRRPFHHSGTGYSAYVTSMNPAGTLPPDAFSLSVGPNPDTGWYYIYVYAYIGAIDSTFTHQLLPVPMPANAPANVSDDPFVGKVGTLLIAHRDSVHVVTQP